MEAMWCENIKIIEDRLRFWPSTEANILIAVGVLGCIIFLIWLFFVKEDDGVWTGIIMIFISLFGLDGLYKAAERNADIFMSDQKVELIGEVSDLEIEAELTVGQNVYDTTGPVRFDNISRDPKFFSRSYKTITPITTSTFRLTINRFSPNNYDTIWFKVGDQLIQSEVRVVGINLANECDGRNCGIRTGDQVRINLNTDQTLNRHHNSKLVEEYYPKILRIERCDDALPTTLSK